MSISARLWNWKGTHLCFKELNRLSGDRLEPSYLGRVLNEMRFSLAYAKFIAGYDLAGVFPQAVRGLRRCSN